MLKRATKQLVTLLTAPIVVPGFASAKPTQTERAAGMGFWEALRRSLGAISC